MGAEDMLAEGSQLDHLPLEVRSRRGRPGEVPVVYYVDIASDRPAWPAFTLGPAADRVVAVLDLAAGVATEARRRLSAAWAALRWGRCS